MSVLLTGADGYLGWPTALRLADRLNERIVCVDNFARRKWVADSGSISATQIEEPRNRFESAANLSLIEGDLTDRDFVIQLLKTHEPRKVLHTAAQPSAPYASINGERALYTQQNNMSMALNILHGINECGLDDTHFIETTTTGIYGAPEFPIPEGGVEVTRQGRSDEVPFPNMGGSWYHVAKSFDAANMRLADTEFEFPITEVRTAIIYGTRTDETQAYASPTRFDFDYYFGTVVNRFCAQAVAGFPITVYGKGNQRKPMVSLEDTVESLVRLAEKDRSDNGEMHVYNQVTRPVAIVELAETIAKVGDEYDLDVEVKHYENPRKEHEEHEMEMKNDGFLDLVGGQRQTLEQGVRDTLEVLINEREQIVAHEDRFLPDVLTDK